VEEEEEEEGTHKGRFFTPGCWQDKEDKEGK
jgi:hypothetical protein